MSECDRFKPIIQTYVAGDLNEMDLGPLLEHCRACETCRGLMELHRDLTVLGARAGEPDEADAPEIAKVDNDTRAVMYLNLTSDRMDGLEITDYADRFLIDRGVRDRRAGADRVAVRRILPGRIEVVYRER